MTVSGDGWLSAAEMAEVDRVMVDDLGIGLVQMMENAGRALATVALRRFDPAAVVVCAGSGGNGGGGMVAARHLANRGVAVTLVTTRPRRELGGVARLQADILHRMGVGRADEVAPAPVVIDAVIGYSLQGAPTGRAAALIDAINASSAAVVALDLPSGVDATTGARPGVAVAADVTVTLAAPKRGLRDREGVGELVAADISVPPSVLTGLGHPAPVFGVDGLVVI